MAIINKSTNSKLWRGVVKRESSCTAGGNANWYNHYGKHYEDSSKTKNRTELLNHMIQQSYYWAYIQTKLFIEKDICTLMFIEGLFTIAKTWKQMKCPLTDEWIKKMWFIYVMENYSVLQ